MLLLVGSGTHDNFFEMASQSSSRFPEQISDAMRASPDAAQLRNTVSCSVQTSFSPGPDPTDVVLSDTEKYLTFSLGTLEHALFPHARRPISPYSFGINSWDVAWNWVVMQIKTNVLDKGWMHSPSMAEIADIFAHTFAIMGYCRFPLHISKAKAD